MICNKYVSIGQIMLIIHQWTSEKHIGDGQRLALVTGRRLPAHGARKEPHEPRSHATLVDNLTVTWEIQQQVSPLPGQLAARHTKRRKLDMFALAAGSSGQHRYKNSNINTSNQISHEAVCSRCVCHVCANRLSCGCIFNKLETLERGNTWDSWQMEGLY